MSIREMNKYSFDNNARLARLLDDLTDVADSLVGNGEAAPDSSLAPDDTLLNDMRRNNDFASIQIDRLSFQLERLRAGLVGQPTESLGATNGRAAQRPY